MILVNKRIAHNAARYLNNKQYFRSIQVFYKIRFFAIDESESGHTIQQSITLKRNNPLDLNRLL